MVNGALVVGVERFYAAMQDPRFIRLSWLSGCIDGIVFITLEAPETGLNVEMVANAMVQRGYEGWWF